MSKWKQKRNWIFFLVIFLAGICINQCISAAAQTDKKPVGVLVGSSAELQLEKQGAELNRYDVIAPAVYGLKGGAVSALAVEKSIAELLVSDQDGLFYEESGLEDERYGIVVNKNRQELKAAINSYLKTFLYTQEYREMEKRWIRPDLDKVEVPQEIKALENREGEELLIGLYPEYMPFEYIGASGEVTGYDVEFAYRMADALGMRPVLVVCGSDDMFQRMYMGEVDILISGISITKERQETFDFTESYYSNKLVYLKSSGDSAVMTGEEGDAGILKGIQQSIYRNLIKEQRYLLILNGLGVTLILVLLTAITGTIGGAAFCYLRQCKMKLIRNIFEAISSILMGIPVVVLILFVCYVVFAGKNLSPILVTVIAFSLNFSAHISEAMAMGISMVDEGQREAAAALGYSPKKRFLRVILPQALRNILPTYRNEFTNMIQMTAVAGYIAVEDLTKAGDIIRSRTFEAFFPLIMISAIYYGGSWLLTLGFRKLEWKLDPANRKRKVKGGMHSESIMQRDIPAPSGADR